MSAAGFLERHGMLPDLISPDRELERFLDEMDSVRRGHPGSLKMIPMALGTRPLPEVEVTVVGLQGIVLIGLLVLLQGVAVLQQ